MDHLHVGNWEVQGDGLMLLFFGNSRCHRMLHKLSDMERPSLRPTCMLLLWKPCRLSCFPEPKVKYRRHDLCLLNILLKQTRPCFGIVLDVGSGSGYLTVCMAEMVGPQGHVVGGEPLFVCATLDHDHMTC